jgi:pimeloyl-ACP methyl ester carboxylesterase
MDRRVAHGFLSFIGIAVCFASTCMAQQQPSAAKVWRVALEGGATIQVLVGRPESMPPRAILVLLPGGDGLLEFDLTGAPTKKRGNFLVRSRAILQDAGFVTALVDAPSDRQKIPGLLAGYRATKQHAVRDLGTVITRLKAVFQAPVIVIGTSRGTVSAVNAARRIGDQLAGVALAAAITQPNPRGATINALTLETITVPTLFVHHVDDQCPVSPAHGARMAFEAMQKASVQVRWATVSGGVEGKNVCSGSSHHGFWQAEGQALGHIKTWLNKILPDKKN